MATSGSSASSGTNSTYQFIVRDGKPAQSDNSNPVTYISSLTQNNVKSGSGLSCGNNAVESPTPHLSAEMSSATSSEQKAESRSLYCHQPGKIRRRKKHLQAVVSDDAASSSPFHLSKKLFHDIADRKLLVGKKQHNPTKIRHLKPCHTTPRTAIQTTVTSTLCNTKSEKSFDNQINSSHNLMTDSLPSAVSSIYAFPSPSNYQPGTGVFAPGNQHLVFRHSTEPSNHGVIGLPTQLDESYHLPVPARTGLISPDREVEPGKINPIRSTSGFFTAAGTSASGFVTVNAFNQPIRIIDLHQNHSSSIAPGLPRQRIDESSSAQGIPVAYGDNSSSQYVCPNLPMFSAHSSVDPDTRSVSMSTKTDSNPSSCRVATTGQPTTPELSHSFASAHPATLQSTSTVVSSIIRGVGSGEFVGMSNNQSSSDVACAGSTPRPLTYPQDHGFLIPAGPILSPSAYPGTGGPFAVAPGAYLMAYQHPPVVNQSSAILPTSPASSSRTHPGGASDCPEASPYQEFAHLGSASRGTLGHLHNSANYYQVPYGTYISAIGVGGTAGHVHNLSMASHGQFMMPVQGSNGQMFTVAIPAPQGCATGDFGNFRESSLSGFNTRTHGPGTPGAAFPFGYPAGPIFSPHGSGVGFHHPSPHNPGVHVATGSHFGPAGDAARQFPVLPEIPSSSVILPHAHLVSSEMPVSPARRDQQRSNSYSGRVDDSDKLQSRLSTSVLVDCSPSKRIQQHEHHRGLVSSTSARHRSPGAAGHNANVNFERTESKKHRKSNLKRERSSSVPPEVGASQQVSPYSSSSSGHSPPAPGKEGKQKLSPSSNSVLSEESSSSAVSMEGRDRPEAFYQFGSDRKRVDSPHKERQEAFVHPSYCSPEPNSPMFASSSHSSPFTPISVIKLASRDNLLNRQIGKPLHDKSSSSSPCCPPPPILSVQRMQDCRDNSSVDDTPPPKLICYRDSPPGLSAMPNLDKGQNKADVPDESKPGSSSLDRRRRPSSSDLVVDDPTTLFMMEVQRSEVAPRAAILTHVIDGFVIQESSEPFPVSPFPLDDILSDVMFDFADTPHLDHVVSTANQPPTLQCENCGVSTVDQRYAKQPNFCSKPCAGAFAKKQKLLHHSGSGSGRKTTSPDSIAIISSGSISSGSGGRRSRATPGCSNQAGTSPSSSENIGLLAIASRSGSRGHDRLGLSISGTCGSGYSAKHITKKHYSSTASPDQPLRISISSSGNGGSPSPSSRNHHAKGSSRGTAGPLVDGKSHEEKGRTAARDAEEGKLQPSPVPEAPPSDKPVDQWTVDDVYGFVASLGPQFADAGRKFRKEEIDGPALMLLNPEQMVREPMVLKLGPALKIGKAIENMIRRRK